METDAGKTRIQREVRTRLGSNTARQVEPYVLTKLLLLLSLDCDLDLRRHSIEGMNPYVTRSLPYRRDLTARADLSHARIG